MLILTSYNAFWNIIIYVAYSCVVVSVFSNFKVSCYTRKKVLKTWAVSCSVRTTSSSAIKMILLVETILSERKGFIVLQKVFLSVTFLYIKVLVIIFFHLFYAWYAVASFVFWSFKKFFLRNVLFVISFERFLFINGKWLLA